MTCMGVLHVHSHVCLQARKRYQMALRKGQGDPRANADFADFWLKQKQHEST